MLKQNEIIELFEFVENLLNENPIEFQTLHSYNIQAMNVIDYLKKINKYDDTDYLENRQYLTNHYFSNKYLRESMDEEDFAYYSFTDLEGYFTSKDRTTTKGYELASGFLIDKLCSPYQYDAFLNTVLAYAYEVKLSEEEEKKIKDYMKKI